MGSRDLFGLDRYPMGSEERGQFDQLLVDFRSDTQLLYDRVIALDGQPLPSDYAGFYNIGKSLLQFENQALSFARECGSKMLWVVKSNGGWGITPQYPTMIPPRPSRR